MKKMGGIAFLTAIAIIICANTFTLAYGASDNLEENTTDSSIKAVDISNVKVSKEDAEKIAKKALEDYFDTKIDDSTFQAAAEYAPDYDNYQKELLWQVTWNMNNNTKNIDISVGINANSGRITYINKNEYSNADFELQPNLLTKADAEKTADDFVKRINPEEYDKVKLEDSDLPYSLNSSDYYFVYYRYENGIPFEDNSIRVLVDGSTQKIKSYEFIWNDDVKFPPKDNIINDDEAENKFKDQVKMNLKYIKCKSDNHELAKLVYSADSNGDDCLDAVNGNFMKEENADLDNSKIDLTGEEKKEWLKGSKSELKDSGELDSEQAKETMQDIVNELYGNKFSVSLVSHCVSSGNKNADDSNIWIGRFYENNSDQEFNESGSISINAITGQIVSLTKDFGNSTDNKNKIDCSKVYRLAVNAVARYFPDKIQNINTNILNPNKTSDGTYTFCFPRLINGIECSQDFIDISFNAYSGEITKINCNWDNDLKVSFKDTDVSSEQAKEIYFDNFKPRLIYAISNSQVKLVYKLKPVQSNFSIVNIDASTGKILDYSGQEISKTTKK